MGLSSISMASIFDHLDHKKNPGYKERRIKSTEYHRIMVANFWEEPP